MSSMHSVGSPVASKCIDGVTTYPLSPCASLDWAVCHSSMCITLNNPQEWLVITVTGYSVNKVVVYNRIDGSEYGHTSRINNAKLIYTYDFAGTSIIHQSSFGTTASSVYTFDFSTTSYVRIQQTTSGYAISLLEVALYNDNGKIPISG